MAAVTEQPRSASWRPLRHEAAVERSFGRVRSYLSAAPGRLLGVHTADGPVDTEGQTDLHVVWAGMDVSRGVRVVLGDLEIEGRSIRIPIRWADARRPRLFPVLEGTLELRPGPSDGSPMTLLVLTGRYAPPLGVVGAVGDSLAGHRLVVESVDRFLGGVIDRLEADLPPERAHLAAADGPPPAAAVPEGEVTPTRAIRRRRVFLPIDDTVWQSGGLPVVERRLRAEPGVLDVVLDPAGLVVVEYDATRCGLTHLLGVVRQPVYT